MDWLPNLTAWHFAAAGAVLALGPVLIHLFNRRRYKTVAWAAMDFLKEAIERNRRVVELRDLILMLLRAAAIALFGLALARPFFAGRQVNLERSHPIHAILLLDNSLSMGYGSLDGNLLDRAKTRAKEFVDQLPSGSRFSIVPAAGSTTAVALEPFADRVAAREAIDRIAIVDRPATVPRAVELARRAASSFPDMPKRVLYLGDQQGLNWRAARPELFQGLTDFQAVRITPDDIENTWVEDIRIEDGIADTQSPAKITALLRHIGVAARESVQVSLKVDGNVVDTRVVSVEPGEGGREVPFLHTFADVTPSPNRPSYTPIEISLTPDRLPQDDSRGLVVPVVSALPVVFIDQYGDEESVVANRLGESRVARKLLSEGKSEETPQLVAIKHLRPSQVKQEALQDARLVVVAGVNPTPELVTLLREYVVQGGPLAIAAGGDFEPEVWNTVAWQDGDGILPLPLASDPVGSLPEEGRNDLIPLSLRFVSLEQTDCFRIGGSDAEQLRDLYGEPYFFKLVQVDRSEATLKQLSEKIAASLTAEQKAAEDLQGRVAELLGKERSPGLSTAERNQLVEAQAKLEALTPSWLSWNDEAQLSDETTAASANGPARTVGEKLDADSKAVQALKPQVLADFENANRDPYMVERRIGRGRVVFVASSLLPTWNTLSATNAVVAFDRLLRSMIADTSPRRNLEARDELSLPLLGRDQSVSVSLQRPGRPDVEPVDVGFVGADRKGITLRGLVERGIYKVVATTLDDSPASSAATADTSDNRVAWSFPLAVNGTSEESQLEPTERSKVDELVDAGVVRWVDQGQTLASDGRASQGPMWWWWLAAMVLAMLLFEMFFVAVPSRDRSAASAAGRAAAT
jgi:hypothetical protein